MGEVKKINWTPELLAECRNENGVVLGMMSEEARRAIIENEDHAETYLRSRKWTNIKNVEIWHFDSWNRAYRISPSYAPPELSHNPYVDSPVWKTNDDILLYRTPLGNDKQLVTAASCTSFAGYVYEGGAVCTSCRLPGGKEGPFSAPIAVRFWTGK